MLIRKFAYLLRYYKFHKLLLHNFWICLLSLIVPMVIVSGIGLFVYSNFLFDTERANYIDALTAQINSIDLLLSNAEKTAVELNAKQAVRMFITDDHEIMSGMAFPSYYSYRIISESVEYLVFAVDTNSYIESIYLYSFQNNHVLSNTFSGTYNKFSLDPGVFDSFIAAPDNPKSLYALRRPLLNGRTPANLITMFKRIYGSIEDESGIIAINIKADYINGIINAHDRPAGQNTYIFMGEPGMVILPPDTALSEEQHADLTANTIGDYRNYSYIDTDGNTTAVALLTLRSDYSGWSYVMEIPRSMLNEKMRGLIPVIAVLFLAIIIASAAIAMFLSYILFKPIGDILAIMEGYGTDGADGADAFISNDMYTAYADLQSIQGRLATRVSMLNAEQARSLQAQISPHFIFNTLQAIRWKAVQLTKTENETSDMIDLLSEITRELINVNTLLVSVRQEIHYAKCYLKIMEKRLSNGFAVNWNVRDDCLDASVPKIILQPLIENAVHHGIRSINDGRIDVEIYMDDNINIVVTDNGPGIADERLLELCKSFEEPHVSSSSHIGLYNVSRRLKLIYGAADGLSIVSAPGSGCRVSLRIPKITPHK